MEAVRLLIVDDSEEDAYLLGIELGRERGSVATRRVDTAVSMREALRESEWDMIIADDAMPGFSALEALGVAKDSGKDVPFIIYSGTMNDRTAAMAMRQGVRDFVEKGDFGRLVPTVERELKSAAVLKAVKRAESHVYRLAYYDDLTGLPNRNSFSERVGEFLAGRQSGRAAVIFVDIDNFMRLNNSFGYATGDALMRQVAGRLEKCAGGRVLLARFRGDEFGMFIADMGDRSEVELLMSGIQHSMAKPFAHDSLEFDMSVSMGVCLCPDDGADAATLITHAEGAMAQAKREPGTSYRYYDRKTVEVASQRVVLEAALRRAIERHELFLNFQPIGDVQTGRIVGTEALVRWRHPENGVIPPDRFIPIADESGLIIPIGEWVMNEACAQTKVWHNMGFRDLCISVNVSAVQFAQAQLLGQVKTALARSGLPPRYLELEITESVLMRDAQATINTLTALKEMGVRLAMDDFGTGYSSLSYLKRFPIDALKIDKSFTQDISVDRDGSAIVSAIAALGRSLQLHLVAEGVETPEQRAFLVEQRCDRMQGYLLSKPLPPDQVTRFLREAMLEKVA
jgi:diguanylate cyclase (GGDEF)-like protein